uniref:Uncharacterized protein n=1 Tax=Arundo donax TaxID=35708 RepID=A0A0A9A4J0_ARUDO
MFIGLGKFDCQVTTSFSFYQCSIEMEQYFTRNSELLLHNCMLYSRTSVRGGKT